MLLVTGYGAPSAALLHRPGRGIIHRTRGYVNFPLQRLLHEPIQGNAPHRRLFRRPSVQ